MEAAFWKSRVVPIFWWNNQPPNKATQPELKTMNLSYFFSLLIFVYDSHFASHFSCVWFSSIDRYIVINESFLICHCDCYPSNVRFYLWYMNIGLCEGAWISVFKPRTSNPCIKRNKWKNLHHETQRLVLFHFNSSVVRSCMYISYISYFKYLYFVILKIVKMLIMMNGWSGWSNRASVDQIPVLLLGKGRGQKKN